MNMDAERLTYIEDLNRKEELSRDDVQELIDHVRRALTLREAALKVSSLAETIYISGLSDKEATALRAAYWDLDNALSEQATP